MTEERKQLMTLLCEAHNISCDAKLFGDATYAQQLGKEADHLIFNGVTIPVHCKDCTNWKRTTIDCGWCSAWDGMRYQTNYCNYGERKDG